jgi:hypothetical protein
MKRMKVVKQRAEHDVLGTFVLFVSFMVEHLALRLCEK